MTIAKDHYLSLQYFMYLVSIWEYSIIQTDVLTR